MHLTKSPLPAPGGSPCSLCSSYLALSFSFTGPCETPVCMELLDHYLASGNRSVAPCTDFFSFACEKANGTSDSFQALTEENKSRLWRLLGEDTLAESEQVQNWVSYDLDSSKLCTSLENLLLAFHSYPFSFIHILLTIWIFFFFSTRFLSCFPFCVFFVVFIIFLSPLLLFAHLSCCQAEPIKTGSSPYLFELDPLLFP